MKQKRSQSIRQKITRLVLLSCGVAALVACSVFAVYDVTTARNSLARDLGTIAEITGSNSTAAIAFDDPQTAREILESLDVQPHIVEACIYTTDGRVFAKYSRSGSAADFTPPPVSPDGVRKTPGFMEVFRQIRLKEDVVGTVYVKSDLNELNARMIQFAWTIVGVVLLSFVVLYFAAGRLQRLISDPILELARTAFAVSTGKDYSLRAAKQSDDEIGFLFDRFNEMLGQVQASNTALQQAREGLEVRVEERTRELKAEVMERIQAQRSLEERTVFLNSLIENSPAGIVVINMDDSVRLCNPAFEKIFGFRQQDILGQPLIDLVSIPELHGEINASRIALQQGRTSQIVTRRRRSDGTAVDVEAFSVPLLSDGKQTGGLILYMDITERKKAELAREERTNFLSSLIDTIPLAVVVINSDFRVEMCNRAFETMFLYRREDILHRHTARLIPVNLAEEAQAHRDALESGKTLHVTTQRRRSDGSSIDVEVFSVILHETDGRTGYLMLYQDITERKLAEQSLLQAKDAAEAASRAKSDFVANVSHEIRTPMNGIIGMTELALDTSLTSEQRDYLSMVKTSAASLLSLINDILDFSKVEAGKLDLDITNFYLRSSIEGTLKELELRARQQGLKLAWRVAPDVADYLTGDVNRLRQILMNLVGNAVKFTEHGKVDVEIEKEPDSTDESAFLHFRVRDTGIGIEKEKQEMVFGAFTQADSSTTRKYGGTGLGLAITKRLVDLMGGKIWLESAPGVGSTFHFTIRFAVPASQAAVRVPNPNTLRLPSVLVVGENIFRPAPSEHRYPRRQMKVLLAEDNAVNRTLAKRLLEKHGHTVLVVENGRQALEALERESVDLVLMDIQMPEMDGFEATAAIREKEKSIGGHLPIIALTAHAMKGDREKCLAAGADDYLTKPIRTSELFEAVDRLENAKSSVDVASIRDPKAPDVNAFDIDAALKRVEGDRELLDEIVRIFAGQCPKTMTEIRNAIRAADLTSLERAAHSLKGSAANLGATAVMRSAEELEACGRAKDLPGARIRFQELGSALEKLLHELEAFSRKVAI
jgi:PAS domain S-box-containing protein